MNTLAHHPARIVCSTPVCDGWYRLEVAVPHGSIAERHLLDNGSAVAVLAAGEPPLLEAIAGNLDGAQPEARTTKTSASLVMSRRSTACATWRFPVR